MHLKLKRIPILCSQMRTGIGHGKGTWGVGDAVLGLSNFIRDSALRVPAVASIVASCEFGVGRRPTSSGTRRVGVFGIWATCNAANSLE